MLKKLRNRKTSKKILIVMAIVIVPAFAFWGFSSLMDGPKEPMYAGSILGKKITFTEYKDSLNAARNTAIMMYGENLSQMQQYINLEAQAWDRLMLLEEAKKRKITANDAEVVKLIQSYPFFQRKGQFDNKLYAQYLRYVFGIAERPYEEQVRQNIILNKFYRQITDNITPDDEETIKKEYRKLNEELSVEYVAAIPSDFSKDITISEEELKAYFDQNSLDFKQPATFNMEYVSTQTQDKIQDLAERLNKTNAYGLLKRLSRPKDQNDFSRVAGEMGLQIKETGFFSLTESIPGIGWSPEILSLVTRLKPGQYSSVIQMDKDFLLLRLKEKKEPFIPGFESSKEKAREALTKIKARQLAYEKIEGCRKTLDEFKKSSPKKIDFLKKGSECGLKADTTQMFKFGSYIEAIGQSDYLWVKAQDLKDEEFSEILDIGAGGYYIIKLKNKTPFDEAKFAAETDEFSKNLLERKKEEYFLKFTQDLRKKSLLF